MNTKNYFAHPSSIIDEPVTIGDETKIWHFTHIMSGAKIGTHCSFGQNVNVAGKAIIGNYVKVQNNVSVYDGVQLEDYVFCGPSMVFTNDLNPRAKYPKGSEHFVKTLVQEGASIGANATIVCGNTIGKHAFIGSGSVVTKSVPDYAIVYGSPAVLKGWMCECGEKLDLNERDECECQDCKRKYEKLDNKVTQVD